jgi:hypothetical protein
MSCSLTISGSLIVSGNLTVLNTASITYLSASFITSSTSVITGSTKFGTSSLNTHQFTGSIFISGGSSIFQQQSIILNAGANVGISSPNISDYSLLYQAGNNLISSTDTGNSLNNTYYIMAYYAGGNFGSTLQSAINSVPSGSIIDCSLYTAGPTTITSPIIINKPVKILLGSYDINVSFAGAASLTNHAFTIASNGVTIEGFSRSPKSNATPTGQTRIIMTEAGDGYHIFGTGSNNVTVQNLDLLGVQSCCSYDLTTGVGGVCFIEPDPGISGAGNTTNGITLSNLFVSGTRDHGIYFVGSIMSTVKDCRISAAGGHGFFTTAGSTSTYFYNCYASSGNLAGFCIHSTSYSTLENCAAEGFGMGYWIRSSNNISLISCGAEENNTPAEGAPLGDLGITFPRSVGTYTVDDWSSDLDNYLKGTSYVITGGENIVLNAPYSRNPNGNTGGTNVFHYYIALASENVTLINPRCSNTTGFPDLLNYDIAIFSSTVKNTMLFFDPVTGGTVTPTISGVYITETNSPGANDTVILDVGQQTQIIGGGTMFRNLELYRAQLNVGTGTNTLTGNFSNAIGHQLTASGQYGTVVGSWNALPSNSSGKFVVGVGNNSDRRKDGFRVDVDNINLSASIMIPINSGDPTSNSCTTGSMWFNPSTNQLRIFNGITWRTIITT